MSLIINKLNVVCLIFIRISLRMKIDWKNPDRGKTFFHWKHSIASQILCWNTLKSIANLLSTLVLRNLNKNVLKYPFYWKSSIILPRCKLKMNYLWFRFVPLFPTLEHSLKLLLLIVYIHNFLSDLQIRPWKRRVFIF